MGFAAITEERKEQVGVLFAAELTTPSTNTAFPASRVKATRLRLIFAVYEFNSLFWEVYCVQ